MIKARIAEDESERRQLARHRVNLDATVRELGTTGIEATVLNISEQGFMAQSEAEFEVGSRVWLMFLTIDILTRLLTIFSTPADVNEG